MKIIVIGAGYSGLSISALLARDGHQVTLLEKHEQVGGRARMIHEQGYAFDMGPSWYMMPEVFEDFFAKFGKKPSDYYELTQLDPHYRIFFAGQETIDLVPDLEKNLDLFEKIEPGSSKRFQAYLARAKRLYDLSMKHFIYRSYEKMGDLIDKSFLKMGFSLDYFASLDRLLKKYFKDERLYKILSYTMVFLGGDPKNTPGIYSLMSHVDFNLGVWYPKGGMNAVAKGIAQLATEQGVEVIYNQDVQKILAENGHATGVQTQDKTYHADLVIMAGDYHHAEQVLLDQPHQSYTSSYWENRTMAPSAFILYLGIDKQLPQLDHHNLFLANDWEEHFDEIFRNPGWPDKPSYYICNPNKTEKGLAPEGKENLFVLVPVAAGLEDTEELRNSYANKIIADLEQQLGESIANHVEVKKIYSQKNFYQDYYSYKGTALGLAHTLFQSAVFRPKQQSKKVNNLFYTGQYTHPGIGVPMVIIAAENLHQLISKNYGKKEHL